MSFNIRDLNPFKADYKAIQKQNNLRNTALTTITAITEEEVVRYISRSVLLLRALKKLLGLGVLLVGFFHLVMELRSTGATRV